MIKKIIRFLAILVLILAGLSFYGNKVFDMAKGKPAFGDYTEAMEHYVTFFTLAEEVKESKAVRGIPHSYKYRDTNFVEHNRLTYDVYGLNSNFNEPKSRWDVHLFNFRNDSILLTWYMEEKNADSKRHSRQFQASEPRNPILLPNRSLIMSLDETNNLYRLDSASNIVWHNTDWLVHHSLNLDADSNIWACAYGARGLYDFYHKDMEYYRDDHILQVDVNTGEALFNKGVAEILIENGYKSIVHGNHPSVAHGIGNDPIHLNDIEPVLEDGKYWKRGDLFISLRHRSIIILYRPSTNEVIDLIFGPFLLQHDVDIHSDHEISLFNNNLSKVKLGDTHKKMNIGFFKGQKLPVDSAVHNEVLIYDFDTKTYRKYYNDHMIENDVNTVTQGFQTIMSNGDIYVESQNRLQVFIFSESDVLLKKNIQSSRKNMIEHPHWIRIYEDVNF